MASLADNDRSDQNAEVFSALSQMGGADDDFEDSEASILDFGLANQLCTPSPTPLSPTQASDSPLPHHHLPSPPPPTTTLPHPSHHPPISFSPNITNITTAPSPLTCLPPSSPLFHAFCCDFASKLVAGLNAKIPKPSCAPRPTAAIPRTHQPRAPSGHPSGASSSPVLPTPIPLHVPPPIYSPLYHTHPSSPMYHPLTSHPHLHPFPPLLVYLHHMHTLLRRLQVYVSVFMFPLSHPSTLGERV